VTRYQEAMSFLTDPTRVTLAPTVEQATIEKLARRYASKYGQKSTWFSEPRHYARAPRAPRHVEDSQP
jgi:hypothetical protein